MYILLLLSLISPLLTVVPVKHKSATNSYKIQAVSIEALEHLSDLVDPDREKCVLSVSTKQMFCEHLNSHELIQLLQSENYATELDAVRYEIVETNNHHNSNRKRRSVPWNLDRLNEINSVLDNSFLDGADVDVYILGSGIKQDHAEFGNRVKSHSVTGDNTDCNGSGTQYASLVGGESMGIARKAQLISVKVVTCNGGVSETNPADITSGINFIADGIAKSGRRSVVLVGFTKVKDNDFNKQLIALSEAGEGGVLVVVGAGNNKDLDACKSSPASAKGESAISGVITVGAIDDNDKVISNIGQCVDVFAPGFDVPAAGNSYNTAKDLCTGSVCAAALAAGVAAQHLRDNNKIDLETEKAMLINGATITDLILPVDTNYYRTLLKAQTPRRVLHYTCGYYRDPSLPECEVYTADCNNNKVTTFDGINVPLYTQSKKECDFVVFENSEGTLSVEGSHYDCTLGTYAIMLEERQIELSPGPHIVVDGQDISDKISNAAGSLLIYEDEGVVEIYHEVRLQDGHKHPTVRVELLEHQVKLTYDCNSKLVVKLLSISAYTGKTAGLCGFYDGIGRNDYKLSDSSTLKKYSTTYHTSWQTNKKCGGSTSCDPSCKQKAEEECDRKFKTASPECFDNENLYKEREACIAELCACCTKHKNLAGWEAKCCQDSYFGNLERAKDNCSICPEPEHCIKDNTHIHCIDDSVKNKYDYMEVIKYDPKDCCYSIDHIDQECLAPRSPAMQWDKPMPVCTIKKCSRPDVPDHTKITPDQSEYECGETVRVDCDNCYKVPPTILTCTGPKDIYNNTGVWDKVVPACVEKECSDPGLPLVDKTKGITYPLSWVKGPKDKMCADKVTFKCDICYDMIGDDTITCEETERWNPANPSCKLRSCNDPTETLTQHLEIDVRRKDCNDTIKHSCDDTCWKLHGAESRTCKVDDNGLILWDQDQPECRIKTCPPLNENDFNGPGKYIYETATGTEMTVDLSPSSASSPNECGATVTAVCDTCHFMCGDRVRSCIVDGVDGDPYWNGERPLCQIKQCRQIENNVTETHAVSAYKPTNKYDCGEQVEMECQECYEYLAGTKVRTCQEDPSTSSDPFDSATLWDGEKYKCKIKNCDKLTPPLNGEILTSTTPLNTCGKTVKFGCDKCHYREGVAEITCQNNKSWSDNPPKCTLWKCSDRYDPIDGSILAPNSNNCGDVIDYDCDMCHYMTGSNSSECLEGGQWSHDEPTCNRYQCQAQSAPTDGVIKVNLRMCSESTEFECDKCYKMKGNKKTTCQHGATWSSKAPTCEMRKCKKPSIPAHTLIEPAKDEYNCGDKIEVKCPECYELGTTILVCEGETWSGVVPSCGLIQCLEPGLPVVDKRPYTKDVVTGADIIHSSYVDTPELNCGSEVSYECDVCYTMYGNDTIRCHHNKQWDELPTCQIKKCDTPIMTSHLQLKLVKSTEYVCRDSLEYECDHECYALIGLSVRSCQPNGDAVKAIWSPKQPHCEIIKCPALDPLKHGNITTTVNTCGTVVTYSCQPCYRLVGPSTRQCTPQGIWSTDNPPICEAVCCPKLDVPTSDTYYADRTLAYMNYTYTYSEEKIEGCGEDHVCQEVDVKCHDCWEYVEDDGTSLSSPPSRVCTHPASGQGQGYWTNTDKMCTRKTCLERIPHKNDHVRYISKIMKDLTNCNDKITWECEPCYENMVTSMYQNCRTDKSWSDTIPACDLKECGALPQLDHCTFKDGYKTCGQKRILECDECYYTEECQDVTNTEIISVQCKTAKNWQWRVKEPLVTIKTCEAPRTIANANLAKNGDGYECGRTIRYQCDECFKMQEKRECDCAELTCVGSGGSTCTMGSWKGEWPTCIPIQCAELTVPGHAKIISSDNGCKQVTKFECDVGYEWVDGDLERTCTTSETWTGKQPICKIKNCTALSAPTNGQISTLDRTYQTTVVFTCNDCYELPRNMTDDSFQEYETDYHRYHILTCEDTGNWNGSVPACAKKSCGHPGVVNNADLIGTKFSCGEQISYKCHEGYYKKSGDDTRACGTDKKWDGAEIKCEIISCGEPKTEPHSTVESIVHTYKGTAVYTCDSCYSTDDVTKVECVAIKDSMYGQWNNVPPKCEIIQCSDVSAPRNGAVVARRPDKNPQDCQQIIGYLCSDGYVIKGARSAMCLDTGTWSSPTPPTCERRCCTLPSQFDNGEISAPNGVCYGDKIEYKCDKCHNLIGDKRHTCKSSGYWSSQKPRCQLSMCSTDFTFENGYHIGEASCGGSREFFCHQGFERQGATKLKCLENGQWSGDIPTCTPNKCDCSAIDTAHANVYVSHGLTECGALTTVRYACKEGYEMKGSSYIWCEDNGQWSEAPPQCSKDKCIAPATPTNGAVTVTSLYQNGEATYTCNQCYKMDGYSTSVCHDGEWTQHSPNCSEITCSEPGVPTNGAVSEPSRTEFSCGEKITYTCDPNHKLHGDAQRSCQQNGRWSAQVPVCTDLECNTLTIPKNGGMQVYDNKAEFTCNTGYQLHGTALRECHKGQWLGVEASCKIQSCGDPGTPSFGSRNGDNFNYKDIVTFICEHGYSLRNNNDRICQHDGTWSGVQPECVCNTCDKLGEIAYGVIKSTLANSFRSIVTYYCEDGYEISGNATRECLASGIWTGMAPTCEKITCGNPKVPEQGSIIYNEGMRYQHTLKVQCSTNKREFDGVCGADGEWTFVPEVPESCSCTIKMVGQWVEVKTVHPARCMFGRCFAESVSTKKVWKQVEMEVC